MEAEIKTFETDEVLKKILTDKKPGPPCLPKSDPFGLKASNGPLPLPPWLSEEDIKYNVDKFDETGFTGGLNYYRALDLYVLSTMFFVLPFLLFINRFVL